MFKYFSVEYYWEYFNVTTNDIIERVQHACFPIKQTSIFGHEGKYDLYGPIWTILTLNTMIFIFGNIASLLESQVNEDESYSDQALWVSSSTGFLTFYFIFIPLALWGLIRIIGNGKDDIEYFFLVSVYGYSFVPFLPAIMIYVIPVNMIKWAVLLTAGSISLFFLAKEMFGKVAECLEGSHVKLASILMLILHLIFILCLKWKFL